MNAKRPTAKDDLRWLFDNCESEMGVRSNFTSFLAASMIGAADARIDDSGDLVNGVQEALEAEDAVIDALDKRRGASRMAATGRNRRVLAAYQRLHPKDQRVLEAAYEARQLPPAVRALFGESAGVVPLTSAAAQVVGFSREWLAKAVAQKDRRLARLKLEAEFLLAAAITAFERASAMTPAELERWTDVVRSPPATVASPPAQKGPRRVVERGA